MTADIRDAASGTRDSGLGTRDSAPGLPRRSRPARRLVDAQAWSWGPRAGLALMPAAVIVTACVALSAPLRARAIGPSAGDVARGRRASGVLCAAQRPAPESLLPMLGRRTATGRRRPRRLPSRASPRSPSTSGTRLAGGGGADPGFSALVLRRGRRARMLAARKVDPRGSAWRGSPGRTWPRSRRRPVRAILALLSVSGDYRGLKMEQAPGAWGAPPRSSSRAARTGARYDPRARRSAWAAQELRVLAGMGRPRARRGSDLGLVLVDWFKRTLL